ncbi:MAG: MarR family transcriptional regulator [Treponema sp.]|nr:MarR family transcriptional regulator [Treponema sp.]
MNSKPPLKHSTGTEGRASPLEHSTEAEGRASPLEHSTEAEGRASPLDTEYIILENIYDASKQKESPRQRDLAKLAGTSLGMTNVILKRLAKKGWITIRKLNNRNIHYAVTLEGVNEIIHRSYNFFRRTIQNMVYYRDSIDEVIRKATEKGISSVLLVGFSDLEFIIEHCCQRYGLSFLKAADMELAGRMKDGHTFTFYAETFTETNADEKLSCSLSGILIKYLAAL